MNTIRNIFFIFTFIIISYNSVASQDQVKLKPGDLLFQDLNCGVFCDGVDEVTYGINNTYISHVGMVVYDSMNRVKIIEANTQGVVLTSLPKFLGYSHDSKGKPMVVVERLKPEYQYLIPEAIKYARLQVGKPYNKTFVPNNGTSYYCSQLIYAAFISANHGQSIFHTHKMSFKDPKTGKTSLIWQNYFDQLKADIPEGLIGTNPGMMSRESSLRVVYEYGKLRQHTN
ncbi:MAG TPA: YiiX/YebB-like N1pC/P60 family cysteine hydrolase [Aquella sp.]|nr:YiiX/YebB-like N1pC/P60 family cysteine hydrolase [Aquella sp.]